MNPKNLLITVATAALLSACGSNFSEPPTKWMDTKPPGAPTTWTGEQTAYYCGPGGKGDIKKASDKPLTFARGDVDCYDAIAANNGYGPGGGAKGEPDGPPDPDK